MEKYQEKDGGGGWIHPTESSFSRCSQLPPEHGKAGGGDTAAEGVAGEDQGDRNTTEECADVEECRHYI